MFLNTILLILSKINSSGMRQVTLTAGLPDQFQILDKYLILRMDLINYFLHTRCKKTHHKASNYEYCPDLSFGLYSNVIRKTRGAIYYKKNVIVVFFGNSSFSGWNVPLCPFLYTWQRIWKISGWSVQWFRREKVTKHTFEFIILVRMSAKWFSEKLRLFAYKQK